MSYFSKIKQLREERAALIEKAGEIVKAGLNDENRSTFDSYHAAADAKKVEIDALEKQRDSEFELAERADRAERSVDEQAVVETASSDVINEAFRAWMVGGRSNLSEEHRQALAAHRNAQHPENRAAQSTTAGAGGEFVPEDFERELTQVMKDQGGMREACRIIRTATGADLPWPYVDDTAESAAILGEGSPDSEKVIDTGSVTLQAYKYVSGIVKVSEELLQDSAFNMQQVVRDTIAGRFVRGTNAHFTNGSGTSQPKGVLDACPASGTTVSVGTTTYASILAQFHAVPEVYRRRPGCRWMISDTFLKTLRTVADSNGNLVFQTSLVPGQPDTILGKPYTVNPDLEAFSAGNKVGAFGDFSQYVIREVAGIQMKRLVERYADAYQVGFVAFGRWDSDYILPSTNKAIVHILGAA